MSDAVTTPSPVMKAAAKPKIPADHPPYRVMVAAAISTKKERGGSSRQAIVKFIAATYKVGLDFKKINARVGAAIKTGVKAGDLKQTKGTGATGSFRLAEKKKVAAKPKKPKAAAKKSKSPKKATKSPKKAAKSPKKAAGAKKTAAKSSKKAAAKSPKKTAVKKAATEKAAKKAAPKPKAEKTPKKAAPKPKAVKTPKKAASKKPAATKAAKK